MRLLLSFYKHGFAIVDVKKEIQRPAGFLRAVKERDLTHGEAVHDYAGWMPLLHMHQGVLLFGLTFL
jgi:hypothetical protein